MPPLIQVTACVIEKEGRYLITQRKKESHLGHLWEFPGGKIEKDESVEACGIRECQEELGIVVRPIKILEEISHRYPEVEVHLYFLQCEWIEGKPQALDCADFAWVRPEELKNYAFPAADKKLIQSLSQNIN